MESSTKKRVTDALVVPVLSLTMLCSTAEGTLADSRTLLERIFPTNSTKTPAADTLTSTAQARVNQLERAMRDLTAQVEGLQFNLLQMQNRLDALEGRPLSHPHIEQAVSSQTQNAVPPLTEENATTANIPAAKDDLSKVPIFDSVRFDAHGQLIEAAPTVILPETNDAQEFYKIGYQYILAGDYQAAEQIFRDFLTRFPDDAQIGDAMFWLGEALYAQGHYREAAQTYIDVQRQHQDLGHGPENMLKLGLSMAQLRETDIACKTLTEVPKRYKQVQSAVLKRVNDEKSRLGCP